MPPHAISAHPGALIATLPGVNEVSIWRPATSAEADIVVAKLHAEGIQAFVMGSLDRSYYPMGQVNVMVREHDAPRAIALIESHDLALEPQPDGGRAISPNRSRRAGLVMALVWMVPVVATLVYGLALFVHHLVSR